MQAHVSLLMPRESRKRHKGHTCGIFPARESASTDSGARKAGSEIRSIPASQATSAEVAAHQDGGWQKIDWNARCELVSAPVYNTFSAEIWLGYSQRQQSQAACTRVGCSKIVCKGMTDLVVLKPVQAAAGRYCLFEPMQCQILVMWVY